MAFQNPNGTIGFGVTIVTAPGGTPVHLDATLTFPGLNGTWRDSAGNSGNLIFGAGIPGGGPRPVPTGGLAPGTVTSIQIAPGAVTHAQIAANAITGANIVNGSLTTSDLAAPRASAALTALFIPSEQCAGQGARLNSNESRTACTMLPMPVPSRPVEADGPLAGQGDDA